MASGVVQADKINRLNLFIRNHWTSPVALALYFALVKLLIHLFTNDQYGYFRDELYFLACSEHLDWGYVDFAPLVALIAKLATTILGTSLPAIRFLPAVAGALKVLLTGLIVKEFGGRHFAVTLACVSVLVAPAYLIADTMLTMNAFEPVFWMGTVYFIILAVNRNEPRFWLGAGVLAGLGIMNKHPMLLFIAGLLIGLLLTKERRWLSDRWFLAAGLTAFIIFLPNLIWQYQHSWPTIEGILNVAATGKNVVLLPLEFLLLQFLIFLPSTAPVWVAGIWFFLFDENGRRYRMFGIAYLVMLAVMFVISSKLYYIQSAYPVLFAGGAVFWEKLLAGKSYANWLKPAYLAIIVTGGAIFAPIALPVLSVDDYLTYQHMLGIEPPKTEVGHSGPLPQWFGDMFGWPEMVETVAEVYNDLPPEERAKAAILAANYGEAGAIDFFGPDYGLPKAISGHQNYYLWGPGNYTGEVLILLGWSMEEPERVCASVEESETVGHPYAMAEEHYTILICRDLEGGLKENWHHLKHWN